VYQREKFGFRNRELLGFTWTQTAFRIALAND
jgi:hypothetical protein